ncbi:hypothetical protein ACI65C_013551, partial [Semiaphis heraclei]
KNQKHQSPQEELVGLACKRLRQTEDSDEMKIAIAWASELQKMTAQQQIFAKKAINDISFEDQMGTLHRNAVQIVLASTRSSIPLYSNTPTPYMPPPPSIETNDMPCTNTYQTLTIDIPNNYSTIENKTGTASDLFQTFQ